MIKQDDKDTLTKRLERIAKLVDSAKDAVEGSRVDGVKMFADLIGQQLHVLVREAEVAEEE